MQRIYPVAKALHEEGVVTQQTEKRAVLSLGANVVGKWGLPVATLARTLDVLEKLFIQIRASDIYESEPIGARAQPGFLNVLVVGRSRFSVRATMLELKRLEWEAGRRPGQRWGPRPLDIDIVDWCGQILNWPGSGPRWRGSSLVLPHPETHRRRFVLVPLAQIEPNWRHPVFRLTAAQLLSRANWRNQRLEPLGAAGARMYQIGDARELR